MGGVGMALLFGSVPTDNGAEFADDGAIARALGEMPGQTVPCYCEPRRSDQRGGCEKNHVEIRKLLPKGRDIRFDLPAPADCALVTGQADSEPRGSLAWMTPAEAPGAAFGDAAVALMDAFGIEGLGMEQLDLTPGCVERARAGRGGAPLA